MIYLRQKNRASHRKMSPRKNCDFHVKTLYHGNNSICSQKYLTPPPPQKQFAPPPPIISTSLENSTATFRNILTTKACNHLNQTTQTKYQPLSANEIIPPPEDSQPQKVC